MTITFIAKRYFEKRIKFVDLKAYYFLLVDGILYPIRQYIILCITNGEGIIVWGR